MDASIVIRTLNEETYLERLLQSISEQKNFGGNVETVIVDSGSTDRTVDIARSYKCKVRHIEKSEFSFGRSLNLGIDAADGDCAVIVSGHCIPASDSWLKNLTAPIVDGLSCYTYGRQIGAETSKYSEMQLFSKYFPAISQIPQDGFFCNNANSALSKKVWRHERFDEELTGLEDMELARRLIKKGERISYIADAPVYHIHDESWHKVRIRYEREAYAMQRIMPEVHVTFFDFVRYFISGVMFDLSAALEERIALKKLGEIVMFRLMQYWGTYRGNHEHRRLSRQMKEDYFYPR